MFITVATTKFSVPIFCPDLIRNDKLGQDDCFSGYLQLNVKINVLHCLGSKIKTFLFYCRVSGESFLLAHPVRFISSAVHNKQTRVRKKLLHTEEDLGRKVADSKLGAGQDFSLQNLCYYLPFLGCGCSAAVEHSPRDREVEGSIPSGRLALFHSLSCLVFFLPFLSDSSVIIES